MSHDTPRLLTGVDLPARLACLTPALTRAWISGPLPRTPAVAIVGTRRPCPEAARFAEELGAAVAGEGAMVISGGAVGIDAAAHRGGMAGSGNTCVVMATGPGEVFPEEHRAFYAQIEEGGGTLLHPFEPGTKAARPSFFRRNSVLVALADVVVVVQAGAPSGALNAAKWARTLRRPLFAVAAPPWIPGFSGCAAELARGARMLTSIEAFLKDAGLRRDARAAQGTLPLGIPIAMEEAAAEAATLSLDERRVLEVLPATGAPLHLDEVVERCSLEVPRASAALLGLTLEGLARQVAPGAFARA